MSNLGVVVVQEQLGAQSAEGRRLRRRVLRGTVLVCIVAGYQGKKFIYERAKELGIRCSYSPFPFFKHCLGIIQDYLEGQVRNLTRT